MHGIALLKPEESAKRAFANVARFKKEQAKNSIRSKLSEEGRKGLDVALADFVRAENWGQAERLLKAGADINFRDERKNGMTLLIEAAFDKKYEVVRRLIEEYGAEVDALRKTENGGDTALIMAACADTMTAKGVSSLETVKILLRHGADANAKDRDERTPLICACGWENGGGDPEVVKMLIAAGADVNAQDENGDTALNYASCQGWGDIVRILIENRADPDLHAKSGETPLMIVSETGNAEVVGILVEAGAELNLKDEEGNTALDRAIKYENDEIAEFLKSVGAKCGSALI